MDTQKISNRHCAKISNHLRTDRKMNIKLYEDLQSFNLHLSFLSYFNLRCSGNETRQWRIRRKGRTMHSTLIGRPFEKKAFPKMYIEGKYYNFS
jgi:hypothetical protein